VDYQIHPVTRAILHADFKKIDLDKTVDVEVKLELVGKACGRDRRWRAASGVSQAAGALSSRANPGQAGA
jgi:hypothetical protein